MKISPFLGSIRSQGKCVSFRIRQNVFKLWIHCVSAVCFNLSFSLSEPIPACLKLHSKEIALKIFLVTQLDYKMKCPDDLRIWKHSLLYHILVYRKRKKYSQLMLDVNHNYKKYHYFNFFAMKISNVFHKYLETW